MPIFSILSMALGLTACLICLFIENIYLISIYTTASFALASITSMGRLTAKQRSGIKGAAIRLGRSVPPHCIHSTSTKLKATRPSRPTWVQRKRDYKFVGEYIEAKKFNKEHWADVWRYMLKPLGWHIEIIGVRSFKGRLLDAYLVHLVPGCTLKNGVEGETQFRYAEDVRAFLRQLFAPSTGH